MSETPKRIQRKRTRGWKMPGNTVYVGRGSRHGNPHRVGVSLVANGDGTLRRMTADDAVAAFERDLPFWLAEGMIPPLAELRGANLACWCPLVDKDGNPVPCHADVLLEIANR